MASPKQDRISQLFEIGFTLQEEYNRVLAARAENRALLRGMAGQGILDDEEALAVDEMYPRRARGEGDVEAEVVAEAA